MLLKSSATGFELFLHIPMGMLVIVNQPGLSNAHVFNYAGKPWLSQYWVRRVKEQAYGGTTPDLGYARS